MEPLFTWNFPKPVDPLARIKEDWEWSLNKGKNLPMKEALQKKM